MGRIHPLWRVNPSDRAPACEPAGHLAHERAGEALRVLHVATLSVGRASGVRRFAYKRRTKCECAVRLQYAVMALARRGSVCVGHLPAGPPCRAPRRSPAPPAAPPRVRGAGAHVCARGHARSREHAVARVATPSCARAQRAYEAAEHGAPCSARARRERTQAPHALQAACANPEQREESRARERSTVRRRRADSSGPARWARTLRPDLVVKASLMDPRSPATSAKRYLPPAARPARQREGEPCHHAHPPGRAPRTRTRTREGEGDWVRR
jgi:hypothetical protein